ncbi:triple tyrosine motif-containing protein [Hathewaya massiliensis]|uniref:triple tyrosine motif-containing protein n=1 Tax=Hathewaya massiliensis TaxID=1964382 RepID=UPI001157AC77|nr:triple tyrosine motif-containing protein [Hathewaya massiliensis]
MNELTITFDKNFFMENGEKAIGIFVNQGYNEPLLYKFLVGRNGMWKVIRDFDKKNYTLWDENREGNYLIMVQAKSENSEKPFDYVVRSEHFIKNENHIEESSKEENKDKENKDKKNKNIKNKNIKGKEILDNEESHFCNEKSDSTTKSKNTYDEKINIFDHISEDEKNENHNYEKNHKNKESFFESAVELDEEESHIENKYDNVNKETELKTKEEHLKAASSSTDNIQNFEGIEDEIKEFEEDAKEFKNNTNKYKKLIKYILVNPKDKYAIDEEIVFTILTENPKNTLTKYKLYIDEVLIEEIGYKESSEFSFLPRCIGTYRFEFYVKKKESTKKFDEVVDYTLNVDYSKPIERIDLECDKEFIRCNEDVTFTANTLGGKNVLYEFYILKHDNWELVQKYSKKNFYTMIPFKKGYYKILVLAKSFHKNIEYENYAIYKFYVNQGKEFIVNSYAFM